MIAFILLFHIFMYMCTLAQHFFCLFCLVFYCFLLFSTSCKNGISANGHTDVNERQKTPKRGGWTNSPLFPHPLLSNNTTSRIHRQLW
jgi:hypothetical protein